MSENKITHNSGSKAKKQWKPFRPHHLPASFVKAAAPKNDKPPLASNKPRIRDIRSSAICSGLLDRTDVCPHGQKWTMKCPLAHFIEEYEPEVCQFGLKCPYRKPLDTSLRFPDTGIYYYIETKFNPESRALADVQCPSVCEKQHGNESKKSILTRIGAEEAYNWMTSAVNLNLGERRHISKARKLDLAQRKIAVTGVMARKHRNDTLPMMRAIPLPPQPPSFSESFEASMENLSFRDKKETRRCESKKEYDENIRKDMGKDVILEGPLNQESKELEMTVYQPANYSPKRARENTFRMNQKNQTLKQLLDLFRQQRGHDLPQNFRPRDLLDLLERVPEWCTLESMMSAFDAFPRIFTQGPFNSVYDVPSSDFTFTKIHHEEDPQCIIVIFKQEDAFYDSSVFSTHLDYDEAKNATYSYKHRPLGKPLTIEEAEPMKKKRRTDISEELSPIVKQINRICERGLELMQNDRHFHAMSNGKAEITGELFAQFTRLTLNVT